jgi:hypothetical protein
VSGEQQSAQVLERFALRACATSAATAARRGGRCARHQRAKKATSTYVNLQSALRQRH